MSKSNCFNRSDHAAYGDAEYHADHAQGGLHWQELYLSGTAITAAGLAAAAAANVIALELDGLALGGCLPDLPALFPRLKRLSLRRCGLIDEDVAVLERLGAVEYLALDFSSISSAGVTRLRGIRSLKTLSLCGVPLVQESLAVLLSAPAIEWLDLRGTGVTNEGVDCRNVRIGFGEYVEPGPYGRSVGQPEAH